MHKLIRITALVAVLAGMAVPAAAATPGEFYLNLLRRGVAAYDSNRYADSAKQLHIAAFGLVDSVDQYQLAQMYLALTHDKLGEKDRAREAAQRVIVAERVERRYAAVTVPAGVRSAFEVLAASLLSPSDLAILRGGAITPAPQTVARPTTVAPPASIPARTIAAPQTTTPQTTTPPRTVAQTPVKPPASQPVRPQVTTPAPQTTTPESTAPQTITPSVSAPAKPKPEPATVKPATKPPATTAAQTPVTGGTQTSGRGGPVEPVRPAAPAPRPLSATEVTTRLAAAERALNGANLNEARRGYRELLAAPGIDHDSLIRIAEGLYRARDFAAALSAFNRIGALRRGEEPYRYYVAVAAYETGDYARAKKELAAALPYIEITPDVARYRTRIEGAR
jgi:tetratricopeptide (TPR) repeat protein